MKKLLLLLFAAILVVIPAGIALASDVSGALYYGTILVVNNGTATGNVSVPVTGINTTNLINGDFAAADLSDMSIQYSGSDIAFDPNSWSIFVPSIAQNDQLNYTMYNNSSGGKIRYFPGSAGATVADDTTLELSDNGSITVSGYVDTSVTGNITDKLSAVNLATDGSGNVTATITVQYDGVTQARIRMYNSSVGSQGLIFREFDFNTGTVASPIWTDPTGNSDPDTAWLNENQAYDNNTGTSASTDPMVAPSTWSSYLILTHASINIKGIRYYAFLNSAGDLINVDVYNGSWHTIYSGAYADDTYEQKGVSNITVSASGVSSGEHTIQVTANTSAIGLYIDGSLENTAAISSGVPDNSNGWTFFTGNVMPYVQGVNITIGGVLAGGWTAAYTSTGNFTDASGNSNDMALTFRSASSDPDVSAVLSAWTPVNPAQSPAYTINVSTHSFVTENLTVSSGFTTTPTTGFAFFNALSDVSTAASTPYQLPLLLGALFTILCISFGVTYLLRQNQAQSLFIQGIVIIALMCFAVALKVFDVWMVIYFVPIAVGCMFAQGTTMQGTGNTGNNMFMFLALNFVGWTIINQILAGQIITSTDLASVQSLLAFQPFKVLGWFTLPVPNLTFITQGLPALLNWNEYTFLSGNLQFITYLMYSITAIVSFMLFVLAIGAVYQFFSRGR